MSFNNELRCKVKKRNLEIYERIAIKKAVMRSKDRAFVCLALRCGLRRSEILALFPEDISAKVRVAKGAIILKTGMEIKDTPKTDAGNRLVPVPILADALAEILGHAKTIPNGQPLFGWLKRHTYWKLWHNIMAKINDVAGGSCHFDDKKKYRVIDKLALRLPFSAHVLRHSYCCDLVRAGYSLDQIKYLMGHVKSQ